MKHNRRIELLLVCAFAALLGCSTFGQAQTQPSAGQPQTLPARIGVIDMVDVLRAHPEFNAEIKRLQVEMQATGQNLISRQKQIQEKSKGLSTVAIGSPQYIEMNDSLTKEASELELERDKAQRKIMLSEVNLKYKAYKSIKAAIQRYAPQVGFVAIVDCKTFEPNQDPGLANYEMNQSVVWNHPQVDITNQIIEVLNKQYANYPIVCNIGAEGKRTYTNNQAAIAGGTAAPGNPGMMGAPPANTLPGGQRQPVSQPATAVRPGAVPQR